MAEGGTGRTPDRVERRRQLELGQQRRQLELERQLERQLVGLDLEQQHLLDRLELELGQQQKLRQNKFIAAIESGTSESHRARVMIVGSARVGKTSLLRSLTDKSFDASEKSTVGVEQNTVHIRDARSWKLIDDAQAHDFVYAEVVSQMYSSQQTLAPGSSAINEHLAGRIVRSRHAQQMFHEIRKRWTGRKETSDEKKHKQMTYSLWDFGGQTIYHITHPMFLTWRAVYILAFDISVNLDLKLSRDDLKGPSQCYLTNLQLLDYWMMSIFMHAVQLSREYTSDRVNASIENPKIIIVGTHRDKCTQEQMTQQMHRVHKLVKTRPYKHQVIDTMFAVDNTQKDDEIERLKEEIDTVMQNAPFMGEETPTRWLLFEDYIFREVEKKVHSMTVEQVKATMNELDIKSDDEKHLVLQQYHDDGRVVYYIGIDLVILDPQWLNDVVTKIIAVIDPIERNKLPLCWDRLERQGVLEEELIDYVWREFPEKKNDLLRIMEKFDLLCEVQREDRREKSNATGQRQRTFFLPSLVKEGMCEREMIDSYSEFGFLIAFQQFLPDGYVHRLYVHLARWAMKRGGPLPIFHFREMSFYADDMHQVVMKMIPGANKIEVGVHYIKPVGGTPAHGSQSPKPSAALLKKFQKHLDETLEELKRQWARRIEFEVGRLCPNCIKYKDDVILPLDQLLEKDIVRCRRCTQRLATRDIHDSLDY